ncbi:MAG: hypothetical protein AB7O30_21445 [Dehalococcoidia bacterium]
MRPLDAKPAEMLAVSQAFNDAAWDEGTGLLREPGRPHLHTVRGTAWSALGWLMRDGPGDRARAELALERVLAQQFVPAGQPFDGTFARYIEETKPGTGAQMWRDYDPNWRQFIGTIFAMVLIEFPGALSGDLRSRLEGAIVRAVEGEQAHGRLTAGYTNIALMHAFLLDFAGSRVGKPEWESEGLDLAEAIHARYAPDSSFEEFNSPTYYGVDLYGLALWRTHGSSARLRALGAAMEGGLWRDIGRFYHAGLRNLCGPFDRAYGMDMTRYVSLVGGWMALVSGLQEAPLPDPSKPMVHGHDFGCLPSYALPGAEVPDDVLEHLVAFQGERTLRRSITEERTATAWLSESVMFGGEHTSRTRGVEGPRSQFTPATVHWRLPDGGVGWIRLVGARVVDVVASTGRLEVTGEGDFRFEVECGGGTADIDRELWKLPGLRLRAESDADEFEVVERGVVYRGATEVALAVG